jgi:ketosteroid isomerase-like protein
MANQASPRAVMERLARAMNARDIDAFVGCFAADYVSDQPAHPQRAFTGAEQVRKNWTAVFEALPDLHAELIALVEHAQTVWTEWHWRATNPDGSLFDWRGVIIMGVADGLIAWGRLYMEPTDLAGAAIDAVVENMTAGGSSA